MPVGFVVAATVMAVADDGGLGLPGVLAAAILVALPILDTTMVVISRRRRGVSVLTGGRDHMTHRLRARLPSARAVAVVLGGLQAILCAAAIGAAQMGSPSLVGLCAVLLVLGASTIGMLETGMWAAPAAGGSVSVDVSRSRAGSITSTASVGMSASVVAGVVGLSAGLSPFVHGAYALSTWGPAALAVAALAVGVSANRTDRFSRPAIAALGSIGFLWVWALASSVWAESADNAMLDAARWLLYATGLLVLVILLQDRRARNVALGAFTGGALVVLAYIAVRIGTGHTSSLFLGARLNGPLGYVNGQAAALLLAFWPLMALAESGRHAALRGSALGAASLLLGVLLLTQTRAVVPALGLSVIALVAVVPGRERRLWALIVIAGALAAVAGSVLDVYSSNAGGTPPVDVVEHAGRWLVVASALAGCVWGIGGAFVSRARAKGASPVERISRPALAVICVVALVGALAAVGNPVERVRGEVHSFVDLKAAGTADSRFLSGGGYRYDYWRVAVRQLQAEPVHGVGAGNFTRTYYRDRHTIENVRQAHSIELQVLGELGLVGGIALGILLTVILVAFGRVAYLARNDPRRIAVAVGAGGLFITWLAHASVDWLNLLPGITGAALIAATVLLLESGGTPRRVTSGGRTAVLGIAVAFAVVAVVTTGRLILADHYRKAAASEAAADPRAALAASGQSIHLNGQGLSARYVRAAAFARLGDYDAAKSSLLDATELEPHNFVSWALLGDLSTRRGDRTAALRYYQRAHALNPLDPSLKQLARG
jgi:O-antigen ligase